MAATVNTASAQRRRAASAKAPKIAPVEMQISDVESLDSSGDDVRYLLDQCESLVSDRDSWKQRAFDAERLIAQLKMDKQELIRAITTTINKS